MADQTQATQSRRGAGTPAPFVVEFGDDNNRQIVVQTVRRTVRGSWSNQKLYRDNRGRNLGELGQSLPDIPGMCVKVEPSRNRVIWFDPLEKDDTPLKTLNRVIQNAPSGIIGVGAAFGPVDRSVEEFDDPHQFKTLIRELVRLVSGNKATLREGALPTLEQIDNLPGEYLYDPAFQSDWKTRFEKDFAAWRDRQINQG
jgi:hypothetical protein